MRTFILMFSMLFLGGCATLQGFLFPDASDKNTELSWQKDLKMSINGKFYYGMATVKPATDYHIRIYPAYKEIDRLQWRTCHRGGHADKAVKHGFWPWSAKQEYFSMTFRQADIEKDRACTLDLEALTMRRKSMSFGMIVFPDSRPWLNLGATLECNGRLVVSQGGMSACQGPYQSIQRIALKSGVVQDDRPNEKCPPMQQVSEGVFEYYMPKGQCVYVFKVPDLHESGRFRQHNLITFGYEAIPPAEDR